MEKKFLAVALIAAALMCSGLTEPKTHHVEATYYVQSGETLWEVATNYMPHQAKHRDVRNLIDDIRWANKMEGNAGFNAKWQPGQRIVIPLEVADE